MTFSHIGPLGQDWVDAYANASGDDNPIHRGENAIVHGALLLILMERFVLANVQNRRVEQLEVLFLRSVPVGSHISFSFGAERQLENGSQQVRVTGKNSAGALCLIGDVVLGSF
jgi:acyl dehydratase